MPQTLLIIGMTGLGWVLPEFFLILSTRNITIPWMVNLITAVSLGCIGYYIAFV